MTTYSFKRQFQDLLRPFANSLDRIGVTPNQITLFACIASFAFSLAVIFFQQYFWMFFLFPLFFISRMALNAIDGMIAKEKNKTSTLGSLLNEICDIFSDFFLVGIFFFTTTVNPHLLWCFIYLSLFAECAGLWSYYITGARSFAGPLGKSDRGITLSLMSIAVGLGIYQNQNYTSVIEAVVVVSILLLLVTIFNRIQTVFTK